METGGDIGDYLKAAIEGRRTPDVGECLDEERLLAFYSTEIRDSEKEAIRDHLADCPRCLNLARDAKEFVRAVGEPLKSPRSIGLAQPEPERGGALLPKGEWWRFWLNVPLRPAVAYSMAAGLLLMLIGGSFLVVRVERLKSEIEQIRAGQQGRESMQLAEERARADSLSQQLNLERGRSAELQAQLAASTNQGKKQSDSVGIVASLILTPGLTRDPGSANTLTISNRTTRVELRLNPPVAVDDYKSYRAVIRTADGDRVWETRSPLKPVKTGTIIVTLPPGIFVKHDHVLSLMGINADGTSEEAERYAFRVLKQ